MRPALLSEAGATGIGTPTFTAVGSGADQSDLAAGAGIFISTASGGGTDSQDQADGTGSYIGAGVGAGTDGADTFRIKIWTEDGGVEAIVYDNGSDQEIGGGSIIVHTGGGNGKK